MSKKHLIEAFRLIEENKDKQHLSGPKSKELILAAEKALSIKIPTSYKLFLEKYGCGGINSLEIYGLTKNSMEDFSKGSAPDAIWSTLQNRKKGYILEHFIHIADTGDGFYYYLDSSQKNEEGEYPVVIWTAGMEEKQKEKIAEDFGEFLLEQVQNALSSEEDS